MKVLVLLLLLAVPGYPSSNSHPEASNGNVQAANVPPAAAIAVQRAKVEVRDMQRSAGAVGSLDPNEQITVSNQVEGLVWKVFVDLGDSVKAGQVLAQLDNSEFSNSLLCLLLTLLFTPVAYSLIDDLVTRSRTKPYEAQIS